MRFCWCWVPSRLRRDLPLWRRACRSRVRSRHTLIISGTIAVVGGLILVALGLDVRELQRIERALASRPMPRPARPAEPAVAAPSRAPAAGANAHPLPSKRRCAHPVPADRAEGRQRRPSRRAAPPAPAAAEEIAFERLRQKFPSLTRIESAPVVEANRSLAVAANKPARPDEYAADAKRRRAAWTSTTRWRSSAPGPTARPAQDGDVRNAVAKGCARGPDEGQPPSANLAPRRPRNRDGSQPLSQAAEPAPRPAARLIRFRS